MRLRSLALAMICAGISTAANAQAVQIETNPTDPKVVTVNRLLQLAQSTDVDLSGVVAKGATTHKIGPKGIPLNAVSLHKAFDKCEPTESGEHLTIESDTLSVWMRCPSAGYEDFISDHEIVFGFKGQKVHSIQFVVIVLQAPGGSVELGQSFAADFGRGIGGVRGAELYADGLSSDGGHRAAGCAGCRREWAVGSCGLARWRMRRLRRHRQGRGGGGRCAGGDPERRCDQIRLECGGATGPAFAAGQAQSPSTLASIRTELSPCAPEYKSLLRRAALAGPGTSLGVAFQCPGHKDLEYLSISVLNEQVTSVYWLPDAPIYLTETK